MPRRAFGRPLLLALVAVLFASGSCARRPAAPARGEKASAAAFAALSLGDALERARSENRLVMVDVYTDWCGWCKKLDSDTFADARVVEALKAVVPIRVNAEKEGEAVAGKYDVRGFPTVLFLSASGEVVRRIEGYVDADEMLKVLASLRKPA